MTSVTYSDIEATPPRRNVGRPKEIGPTERLEARFWVKGDEKVMRRWRWMTLTERGDLIREALRDNT